MLEEHHEAQELAKGLYLLEMTTRLRAAFRLCQDRMA
jgi:hypothetical protein